MMKRCGYHIHNQRNFK